MSPEPASTQRRSSGFDDYYDSAVPVSVLSGWERVEEDLGLDEAPGADPQEWEEMVSLLSFDGEEHKKVTRYAWHLSCMCRCWLPCSCTRQV